MNSIKRNKNKTDVEGRALASTRAITLITLVITIILLIILAGIVINISIGENGLFKRAKDARNKYLTAEQEEQKALNELYDMLGIEENLPENTPTTIAGTKVKLPDEWSKITPTEVQTLDGKEVVASRKVSSVYAVALGEGKTVPVPNGFYYVGGNFETGVVISDNESDKNKYANTNGEVPSGVTLKEALIDGTKRLEFVDELKGNQFVFIPCTKSEYKKTNWGQGNVAGASNCYWGTETSKSELAQVEKYGGFYVARYEAGLPTSQDGFSGDEAFTSALSSPSNSLANTTSQYNSTKTPISKAGREPWNFVDYNNSWASAEKMYNTSSVKSGLITGTQWDVMINKIASTDSSKSLTDSKSWGNYYTGEAFTYTGRAAEYKTSDTKLYGYGNIEENGTKANNTHKVLTTGASEHNKAYNLYDVAGNLWEWTEESAAHFNSIGTLATNRVTRGGSVNNVSTTNPVRFRNANNSASNASWAMGYRMVLNIM